MKSKILKGQKKQKNNLNSLLKEINKNTVISKLDLLNTATKWPSYNNQKSDFLKFFGEERSSALMTLPNQATLARFKLSRTRVETHTPTLKISKLKKGFGGLSVYLNNKYIFLNNNASSFYPLASVKPKTLDKVPLYYFQSGLTKHSYAKDKKNYFINSFKRRLLLKSRLKSFFYLNKKKKTKVFIKTRPEIPVYTFRQPVHLAFKYRKLKCIYSNFIGGVKFFKSKLYSKRQHYSNFRFPTLSRQIPPSRWKKKKTYFNKSRSVPAYFFSSLESGLKSFIFLDRNAREFKLCRRKVDMKSYYGYSPDFKSLLFKFFNYPTLVKKVKNQEKYLGQSGLTFSREYFWFKTTYFKKYQHFILSWLLKGFYFSSSPITASFGRSVNFFLLNLLITSTLAFTFCYKKWFRNQYPLCISERDSLVWFNKDFFHTSLKYREKYYTDYPLKLRKKIAFDNDIYKNWRVNREQLFIYKKHDTMYFKRGLKFWKKNSLLRKYDKYYDSSLWSASYGFWHFINSPIGLNSVFSFFKRRFKFFFKDIFLRNYVSNSRLQHFNYLSREGGHGDHLNLYVCHSPVLMNEIRLFINNYFDNVWFMSDPPPAFSGEIEIQKYISLKFVHTASRWYLSTLVDSEINPLVNPERIKYQVSYPFFCFYKNWFSFFLHMRGDSFKTPYDKANNAFDLLLEKKKKNF